MHRALIPLLAFLGLLVVAAPAGAAVVPGSAGGTQVYLTSDEAGDELKLRCEGGQTKYLAINLLPCADVEAIFITGNGGVDLIDLSAIGAADFPKLNRVEIDAGTGVDNVTGSQVADTIEETFENDVINALGGDDFIEGGGLTLGGVGDDILVGPRGPADGGVGDDRFEEPSGEGPFSGGPGMDAVKYNLPAGLNARIDLYPEDSGLKVVNVPPAPSGTIPWSSIERAELLMLDGPQIVDASRFSGVLEADGRGGPDTLVGGPQEDFLDGGPGEDSITGGAGFDWVNGGLDADRLLLRDAEIDRGICGDGADVAIADPIDSLLGCESVDLGAAPSSPPADTKAPDTKNLKGPKKVTKGKAASFTFASTETGSTFKCKLDKGKAVSCKSPFKVKTGKLSPGKHTISVFAVDAAGNADPTPASRSFTVEKARKSTKRG